MLTRYHRGFGIWDLDMGYHRVCFFPCIKVFLSPNIAFISNKTGDDLLSLAAIHSSDRLIYQRGKNERFRFYKTGTNELERLTHKQPCVSSK